MGGLLLLAGFVFSVVGAFVFMVVAFLLLPWARHRMGGWSLALFPLSTFMGSFFGWAVLLMFIKAMET